MFRRLKGEDRIEMIIRGLLKQPENRRCINCNSLGPQYVCTTFWTFVCTNCSGVHRDFTHRVKSVSMAKFNEEEIMALQAGGNERAREIYFKEWDPLRNHYPDGSNTHRLREFVKHVYVDRKYAGANSCLKLEPVSNSSNRRSSERTSNGSMDEFHDRCPLERQSSSPSFKDIFEERSLQVIQEPPRSSRQKSRVAHFEIVDDRFRDDGGVKRYERYSSKESSPYSGRSTSLPAMRPVKEFLGSQVSLTVGGTHKADQRKDAEASAKGLKAAEAPGPMEKVETLKVGPKAIEAKESGISAKGRKVPDVIGGIQMQSRTMNTRNLSECETKSEVTCSTAEPPTQPMTLKNNGQISSTDSSESQIVPNPPKMTSLESLLYELSVSMTSPPVGGSKVEPNSPKAADVEKPIRPAQVCNNAEALVLDIRKNDQPLDTGTVDPMLQETQVHQLPYRQQQSETSVLFSESNNSSNVQQHVCEHPKPVESIIIPIEQASKAPNQRDGSTTSGKKELPQEFFTSNLVSFAPGIAGWQRHPPSGTGYGMKFQRPVMSATGFQYPSRPGNPFDIGYDASQVEATMFSSMPSSQEAPSNKSASTTLGSQSLPYAAALPYQMNMPRVPGAYMRQPTNNMLITRPQGLANLGSYNAFASLDPIQQANRTESSSFGHTEMIQDNKCSRLMSPEVVGSFWPISNRFPPSEIIPRIIKPTGVCLYGEKELMAGGGAVAALVFLAFMSGGAYAQFYTCWGGCYNVCFLSGGSSTQSDPEMLACYYQCLNNNCVPRTNQDYQYYCQIGCSLERCAQFGSDGERLENCFGGCHNLCKI